MDKLLALKMFVETVDAKGFSAAARRLDLATSSVTRAVDGLETTLGAVLVNRSPRLITVTEAGRPTISAPEAFSKPWKRRMR